jgi:hypothetical protein
MLRLMVDMDQRFAELSELMEEIDQQSDEATEIIYRMVCLHAGRAMIEDMLKLGEQPDQPNWSTVLTLNRLSKEWPRE